MYMMFDETLVEKIFGFKASDAQLLEMITSDADLDKSGIALEVLISRHRGAIQAAISSAGARTPEDKKDAFGEFGLKVAKEFDKNRLTSIREREAPVKWLYTTARNATVDYMRSLEKPPTEVPLPSSSRDPLDDIISKEDIKSARKCVKQHLSEPYVQVFDLHIKEYTRSEIAKELRIKIGTVDSRLRKVRETLRRHRKTKNGGES